MIGVVAAISTAAISSSVIPTPRTLLAPFRVAALLIFLTQQRKRAVRPEL
jgi:hypothetical protein